MNHECLELGALIDQSFVFINKHSIISFQVLVHFLQLLDLEHTNLVLLSFFTLTSDIIGHEFDRFFAESEIALKHTLFGQVLRLEVAEEHLELSHWQSQILIQRFFPQVNDRVLLFGRASV